MPYSEHPEEGRVEEGNFSIMQEILLNRWRIYERYRTASDTGNRLIVAVLALIAAILFAIRPELSVGSVSAGIAILVSALWGIERTLRDASIREIEQKFAQSELDRNRTTNNKEWVDNWITLEHTAKTSLLTRILFWVNKLEPLIWIIVVAALIILK